MNFYFSGTFRALSVAILLLLPAILLAWPTSFLMRGSRLGYGRNIRPLHCKAKGQAGICMFAWDCMKASGTHLGTCVDRFYFGSCCQLKSTTGPNEIPMTIDENDTESDKYDSELKPSVDSTPIDIYNIITEESTDIEASEGSSNMTEVEESVVPSISDDLDSEVSSPDSPAIDESNHISGPTETGHITFPDGGTLISSPDVSNTVDIFASSSGSDQVTGSEALKPSIPDESSSTIDGSVPHPSPIEESESPLADPDESESPSAVVEESESSSAVVEESEFPSAVLEESESPSAVVEESEFPTAVVEESESPSAVVEESESPSAVVEESESPSAVVEESESPSTVVEESESPSAVVEESESPSAVVEESESPSAVIEESESPSAVIEESESPSAVVEESESPSAVVEESESPSAVVEESESPSGAVEESESPSAITEETESSSSLAEEAESPQATIDESESPLSTADGSKLPPATAEESSHTTEDSESYPATGVQGSEYLTSTPVESTSTKEPEPSISTADESESSSSNTEESGSQSSTAEEFESVPSVTEESVSVQVTTEESKPSSTAAEEHETSPASEGSESTSTSTLSSVSSDSTSSSLDFESNYIETEASTPVSSSNTESTTDELENQTSDALDAESSVISGTPSTIDSEIAFDGDADNVSGTTDTGKPEATKSPENTTKDFTVDPTSEFNIIPIAVSDILVSEHENVPNTSGTLATDEAPAPTDTLGITDPMGSELENAGDSTTPTSSTMESDASVAIDSDTSSVLSTSENETLSPTVATEAPSTSIESELVNMDNSTVESTQTTQNGSAENIQSLIMDILPGIQIVIDADSQTDLNASQPLVPILIDVNNQTGQMEIIFPDVEHTTENLSELTPSESTQDTGEPESDGSLNLTESSSVDETTDKTEIETNEPDTESESEKENETETEEVEKDTTVSLITTTESFIPTSDKEQVTVILDGEAVTKPSTDDSMVTLVFPDEETDDKIIFTTTSPITHLINSNITYEEQEDMIVEALKTANYQDICGVPVYPSSRIVGGAEASYGQWPWQVSLRQWRSVAFLHKCGAALVNENWAITAAHCVEGIEPDQLLLVMGEYDLGTPKEPYTHIEKSVQVIAMHPKFEPRTFEFDLALLRFAEPIEFQPNIIPICIPTDDYDFLNHTGYVTGWGRLYEDGPLPTVMQKVSVPIIPNNECEDMYKEAGYIEHIPKIFICAGYQAGKQDSCEGDSGGPLVIQHKDRWNLAGVISWGIGCAVPNQPGVYTRISEFREWINKIIIF